MKRLVVLFTALCLAGASVAQNADSLAFMSAQRQKLRVKKAEAFSIVAANIFDSPQTISVIKYSPKNFSTKVALCDEVTITSEVGIAHNAQFAINACFWAVKKSFPSTYIKSDGVVLSHSHTAGLPRVNGLFFIYGDRAEIVRSTDMPDYPSLAEKCDKCDNIFACGPVLIDDGEEVCYKNITESKEKSLQRKIPFFIRRHPRTAIGCDAKGNIIMVVVDGRSKGNAAGVTIAELTQICKWLGMTEAMNLDGGSSSTMWGRKYGVINHPCGNRKFDHEGERKVMSVLVVNRKKGGKKR